MRRDPMFLLCAATLGAAACTPREDCVPRCLAWVPIYDPEPMVEGEFLVLAARDPTTDSTFIGLANAYYVPRAGVDVFSVPERGLDLSVWRVFHDPQIEVAPGLVRTRDPFDTVDAWRYGVTLAEHATHWGPLRKLAKDDYPEVVLADMAWQGPESFPEWAQQLQESAPSLSYLDLYGSSHPPPPAVEYNICRYYTGDPSINDTWGKGACNHPDLPNEANGWEGTSWAEMP
jgi:hypothetical protein